MAEKRKVKINISDKDDAETKSAESAETASGASEPEREDTETSGDPIKEKEAEFETIKQEAKNTQLLPFLI